MSGFGSQIRHLGHAYLSQMKIIFFGTPEFAVTSLEALLSTEHELLAVVTAADSMGGRGGKQLLQSEVKVYAQSYGITVLQPSSLKSKAFAKTLRSYAADLFVVVAFRMLPEMIWNMPPLGSINVHGSLLPAYRGAAPIHWAVINGESSTGVSVFFLQHAIDTGDILHQRHLQIGADQTTGEVYERLKKLGAEALLEALRLIQDGKVAGQAQDASLVSHAPKLKRDNTRVDWHWASSQIHNFVRGLNPFPLAWTQLGEQEIKVLRTAQMEEASAAALTANFVQNSLQIGRLLPIAAEHSFGGSQPGLAIVCGDGRILELLEVKPAGKRSMNGLDWRNGLKMDEFSCLS